MTGIAAAEAIVTEIAAETVSVMARAMRAATAIVIPTATHRGSHAVTDRATAHAMHLEMGRANRDAILLVAVRRAVLPPRPPIVQRARHRRLEWTTHHAMNLPIAAAKRRLGPPLKNVANASAVNVADEAGGDAGADDATAQNLAMARRAALQPRVAAKPATLPHAANRRTAVRANPVVSRYPAVDSPLLRVRRRLLHHRSPSDHSLHPAGRLTRRRRGNMWSGRRRRNPAPAADLKNAESRR